jgi:hypothetical protein
MARRLNVRALPALCPCHACWRIKCATLLGTQPAGDENRKQRHERQ